MARPRSAAPAHGTRARYGRRCRCDACRDANTRYQRLYRERTRPTVRTSEVHRYRVAGVEVEQHPLW